MNITKRQFISGLSKGALGTAVFNAPFWARNVFAQTGSKKAIFIYHPDGCSPPDWHPTQTGTNFTLPVQTSPLESVKQHCVFLNGLEMVTPPGGHDGQTEILTADHDFSIDQLISSELGASHPFRGIHLGVGSNFLGGGRFSVLPGNVPVSSNDDPLNAFNSIFGGSNDVLEQQRMTSILSTSKAEVARLRSRLGLEEKAKLDQHEQSIFEVEQRLSDMSGQICNTVGWNSQAYANNPNASWPATYYLNENFDTVARLQIDLIVLALKCGMTPVATLSFSHPVSPFTLATQTEGNHNASHNGKNMSSPLGLAFTAYKQYWCELLKYLIDELNVAIDTDGNPLLQNTLVFMGSELGESNDHDHKDMPFVLAGNAGGSLVTGRSLAYTSGTSHSQLLVSIANKMGINIDTFGDGLSGPGGLSGL